MFYPISIISRPIKEPEQIPEKKSRLYLFLYQMEKNGMGFGKYRYIDRNSEVYKTLIVFFGKILLNYINIVYFTLIIFVL